MSSEQQNLRCLECGAAFSVELSGREYVDANVVCPKCDSDRVRRVFVTGHSPSAALKFDRKYPYTSNRLPLWKPGLQHTDKGKCIVTREAERDLIASGEYVRE